MCVCARGSVGVCVCVCVCVCACASACASVCRLKDKREMLISPLPQDVCSSIAVSSGCLPHASQPNTRAMLFTSHTMCGAII